MAAGSLDGKKKKKLWQEPSFIKLGGKIVQNYC